MPLLLVLLLLLLLPLPPAVSVPAPFPVVLAVLPPTAGGDIAADEELGLRCVVAATDSAEGEPEALGTYGLCTLACGGLTALTGAAAAAEAGTAEGTDPAKETGGIIGCIVCIG